MKRPMNRQAAKNDKFAKKKKKNLGVHGARGALAVKETRMTQVKLAVRPLFHPEQVEQILQQLGASL